ncbi:hypothetical protein [Sulfurospirillum multivorans]|uniref:Uncharacterized protein n=2 Tax=Sulfurospirillum multivorans TaxID=66821 RepID=A0AA86APB7_SULMK|nr:hypothetical protein [Sulfurospirillum multivorans]AHJ13138.1 hypothetical protein SMUL_1883 [Sulfurospirillum multivorans DSM 12446]QEH06626.1 hypothetical protein SMN_1861 [Sulfurospirillum multivorans]
MKNYYELSMIDDFGSGIREYFYTNEATIRKLTYSRYKREKRKASVGDRDGDMHQNEPLFNWNKTTSTGYVIQHCGFTMKNIIEWKKLDLGLKRYKNSLYALDDVGHFMVVEHINVFASVKEGLKALRDHSSKAAQNVELAKEDEDGCKLRNGQVRHVVKDNRATEYLCPYHFWVKTSYEYEEWDLNATGFILHVKEVKYL